MEIKSGLWARSIEPKFPEISAQNSLDHLVHLEFFRKNGSTFRGGPIGSVGLVGPENCCSIWHFRPILVSSTCLSATFRLIFDMDSMESFLCCNCVFLAAQLSLLLLHSCATTQQVRSCFASEFLKRSISTFSFSRASQLRSNSRHFYCLMSVIISFCLQFFGLRRCHRSSVKYRV